MVHGFRIPLILGILIVATACTPPLEVRTLTVGGQEFRTEIAATPEARERGWMERRGLDDQQAMLFVFPDEAPRVFWMKNTPTALSIAYINRAGVIKEIHDMQPESLAPVASRYAVPYALEVVQGAFERRGIAVGDRLDLVGLKGLSAGR